MTEVKQTEPTLYVLGLNPIDIKIATSIDCGADFRGHFMAATTILQAVNCAKTLYPDHLSLEWLEVIEGHTARVKNIAASQPLLATVDDGIARERVYGPFARPTKATVSTTALAHLNGAIGLIVLSNVVQSRTMSASVTSAWTRLQKCGSPRKGRHPDWERLATNFPKTREEVSHWLDAATEADMVIFLKTLDTALDTPLLSPRAIQSGTSGPYTHKTADCRYGAGNEIQNNLVGPQRTVPEPPESYTGWLIQRANQSGFLGHLLTFS